MKITRPAALVRQGSLRLYTTSLKVADLRRPGFYQISKLDPEGDANKGYQRLLNAGRARKLEDYLVDGSREKDAFLPTSIFLATSKDVEFDPATNTISFDVEAVGAFSVVDGQHRIAGLIRAAEREPSLLDFEVPVNIAVRLDDVSQMCHFLIVNTTQKSVDKAVEQQIVARLSNMIAVTEMPSIPRWIRRQVERGEDAKALEIVNHLISETDSPWFGKIFMANEEGAKQSKVTQKSFVNSLKRYVFSANNPLSNPSLDIKRPAILLNYWKAIAELLIDENSEKSSVVLKTNGADFFHMVSTTVFTHLLSQGSFTKEAIKKLLERGFQNLEGDNLAMASPEWWESGSVASGLNTLAVTKLAHLFNRAVNTRRDIGEITL